VDVTGRPLQICAEEEISALGAGVLVQAATRGGKASSLHQIAARSARYSGTVLPDGRVSPAYDAYFQVYQRLFAQLRDVFPKLTAARQLSESLLPEVCADPDHQGP
jgi:xylulokinase